MKSHAFGFRSECGLHVADYYCGECGLLITLRPLKPAELADLLKGFCEDCGEPLVMTLHAWG
jgi:hypothetical protein